MIKFIKKEGTKYIIDINEVVYTEIKTSGMPVELVYTDVKFEFFFDISGEKLEKIVTTYSFTQDGVAVTGKSTGQILNVGTTVVEAPVVE